MAGSSENDLHSFEPFTRHRFYDEVNRALIEEGVRRLPPSPSGGGSVVDLSCGTGAMTLMLVEALRESGRDATVVGVEPSPDALARAELRAAEAGMEVRFLRGDAGDLAGALPEGADGVFFGNAIHLVDDKDATLREIAGVLVPHGVLAFNSAFFTGAYAPGTEGFYKLWTVRAMRILRREHPDVRLSREAKSAARRWLSREEYEAAALRNGFDVLDSGLDEVRMDLASFQDIARYRLFVEGALPGAPIAAGADALVQGVAEAFDEMGLDHVPRHWLRVVARRSEKGPPGRDLRSTNGATEPA